MLSKASIATKLTLGAASSTSKSCEKRLRSNLGRNGQRKRAILFIKLLEEISTIRTVPRAGQD